VCSSKHPTNNEASDTSNGASVNPNRVKLIPNHLGAQPDGESTTWIGASVELSESVKLIRKLTQEVNNTRLRLVTNSAIVEPQLDVSSQVAN